MKKQINKAWNTTKTFTRNAAIFSMACYIAYTAGLMHGAKVNQNNVEQNALHAMMDTQQSAYETLLPPRVK